MKKEWNGKIFWENEKMQNPAEVGMEIATRAGRADGNVPPRTLSVSFNVLSPSPWNAPFHHPRT